MVRCTRETTSVNETVQIGPKTLGKNQPVFVIAEISANHGGSLDQARALVRAAKECGADAVKFQTFTADTITLDSTGEDFRLPADSPWSSRGTLHQLYQNISLPWEWHEELFALARSLDLSVFSSPFDPTAVELLEKLDTDAYKIASPEITDIPLIRLCAQKKRPLIISTGLAELEDIDLAVKTFRDAGGTDLVLLKCISAYPAPPEESNLKTIPDLANRFSCLSGLSDHSLGIAVPIAAVALGAKMIERHFVLDRNNATADSFFSADPKEFTEMVKAIRIAESALGTVFYGFTPSQKKSLNYRRSLYVAEDIKKGTPISKTNVRSVRPGFGMHPKFYDQILGKKANRDLAKGERMSEDVLDQS